jgi:hypothetical protein
VRELETEYEGRIDFSIIQTATEEGSDVEQYDVGNHGLVIFDADGKAVASTCATSRRSWASDRARRPSSAHDG